MNEILRDASERLRTAGVESPRTEARLLWERAQQHTEVFASLLKRRLAHEPIAYITGHKEFWSFDLEVGPGVLIPRPETETLVEMAFAELPDRYRKYRVLELGTGSACLLIALLKEYVNAEGVGIDNSAAALAWARRNIARYHLEDRVELMQGGWDAGEGLFDLILCNPPYIATGDLPLLSPDVRDYEPRGALDGGEDGFAAYRAIAPILAGHLGRGGLGLLEIGRNQHHMVGEIMAAERLKVAGIGADLAGIPRCVAVRAG